MSLPDRWIALEPDEMGAGVVAEWWTIGPGGVTVSLRETGEVMVDGAFTDMASFPVELLPHVQGAWVNHQRSRAP